MKKIESEEVRVGQIADIMFYYSMAEKLEPEFVQVLEKTAIDKVEIKEFFNANNATRL